MLREGDEIVFLTDALTYPSHVVVAIANPCAAWAMQIHKSEYNPEDALRLAELMGFKKFEPSAMDRAGKAKHAKA